MAIVLCCARLMHAGGPEYVAGSSYFDSSAMGQPLVWAGGQINYYTDQGDLSPILPNSAANVLVANSFLQWTSVASAAVIANDAGQLAEDVNGSNLEVNFSGTVTAPADITPSAMNTPVGIVYDYDGSVTDALLGAGAGDASQCFWNAVYGGVDNFGVAANLEHALVVINGQCAVQSSQLTDVEYRLVRVLGNVLGLGWSQLNLNVITGYPTPTTDDFAGFPVMHSADPATCIPITVCYANPYQLAADDIAALSRLYPLSSPPPTTARIYGSVYFSNRIGGEGQPMQGVNVFARWIDPSTSLPSHRYAASSVSGFLFTGNAGNPITGWTDSLGNAYSEFGSDNQISEGFFDLGGLPIPNGAGTAQYQISIEALDPAWSAGVSPYEYSQVTPSGTFQPITVTVSAGGEFEQNIQMSGSGLGAEPWAAETWSTPAVIPAAGDWIGSISGYGDTAYFLVNAQANRTFSLALTALDEVGGPSESKAEPVMGIWAEGDPQGTVPPAFTPLPFNSETFAMSLLAAQVLSSSSFIIGVGDLRGDGRPDYQYHAHLLYGDSVSPPRVPVSGGAVVLQGIGFAPGQSVTVGNTNIPAIASDSGQILLTAAAQSDGPQSVTITDPITGASSTMTGVLTFGAAASDRILLLQGANPLSTVGVQATNPVSVRVVAADGVTPVWGATVGWTGTNNAALSSCGGISSCSAITDEGGNASTSVTPSVAGIATITATLAPGVYNPAQSVSGTLDATSPSQSIGVTAPNLWIAQGASFSVPLTARVLSLASPQGGVTVNFIVDQGTASLSSSTATTNSAGYATVTLSSTNFTSNVQLSACVLPGPGPCQTIYGNAVATALMNLQPVAGGVQVITGQSFQPLTVRVTDSSTPPNPVLGASVLFQSTVMRPSGDGLTIVTGDSTTTQTGVPSILGAAQSVVQSNANGLASIVPSVGPFNGLLEIQIQIAAGTSAFIQDVLESFP
ncbi:MAG: Ig-like domain-containing protein [Candidatus Sulfotelmatobacter sp.]